MASSLGVGFSPPAARSTSPVPSRSGSPPKTRREVVNGAKLISVEVLGSPSVTINRSPRNVSSCSALDVLEVHSNKADAPFSIDLISGAEAEEDEVLRAASWTMTSPTTSATCMATWLNKDEETLESILNESNVVRKAAQKEVNERIDHERNLKEQIGTRASTRRSEWDEHQAKCTANKEALVKAEEQIKKLMEEEFKLANTSSELYLDDQELSREDADTLRACMEERLTAQHRLQKTTMEAVGINVALLRKRRTRIKRNGGIQEHGLAFVQEAAP